MVNPFKVAIILCVLKVPFEWRTTEFSEMKQMPYLALNPNGRAPTIFDPNTGMTLWESGAIIEYLIDEYDKDNKFSFSESPEKYYLKQWLFFQTSGHGPYIGQLACKLSQISVPKPSVRANAFSLRVLLVPQRENPLCH